MTGEAANPGFLRLDRWMWFARFFKTRTLATRGCTVRRIRINGTVAAKPNHPVRVGDVLTFAAGRSIRVVRVTGLGVRRGPAAEARTLYEDLAPAPETGAETAPPRDRGGARPTKADRRALDRLRGA